MKVKNNSMKKHSVLILDDDKEFLSEVSVALSGNGFKVLTAETVKNAKSIFESSRKEVDRLLRFTKNMLELSRIESGRMPIKRTKIGINSLMGKVIKTFDVECKKKGVNFIVNIKKSPVFIWVDADLMEEVLTNLLGNALKYTPASKTIKLETFTENNYLRIEVKDQGPGVPLKLRKKIFDKFYRVSSGEKNGTGLGLSIAKEIVDIHKGNIWVESKKNKGATFIVTLPLDLRLRSKKV